MLVRSLLFVISIITFNAVAMVTSIAKTEKYAIADSYTIQSEILKEERNFFVSTPVGYDSSQSTYPVLILLDGKQNLEHSVASARMLSQWQGVPGVIIVAIASKDRVEDFTPSNVPSYSDVSGGASKFARFIEQEVMSFVDDNYRTHPYRVLEGHSLGGTFAVSQILQNSKFYQAYIVIGPALWWNSLELINKVENDWQPTNSVPLYLGIGEHDGYGMKQDLSRFVTALNSKVLNPHHLQHVELKNEGHMSSTLPAVYQGLQHVFKEAKYSEDKWPDFTPESFQLFLQETSNKYGTSIKQTGELFAKLAQHLVSKRNYSGAISVLKENLKQYPENLFNYEELAHAYVLNDQPQLAIAIYKRAIKASQNSASTKSGVEQKYLNAIKLIEAPYQHSLKELKDIEGCYRSASNSQFDFTIEENKLIGKRKDWSDFTLFSSAQNQFFMRVQPNLQFTFNSGTVDILAYGTLYTYNKVTCKH